VQKHPDWDDDHVRGLKRDDRARYLQAPSERKLAHRVLAAVNEHLSPTFDSTPMMRAHRAAMVAGAPRDAGILQVQCVWFPFDIAFPFHGTAAG
jgi:hypothetical protein